MRPLKEGAFFTGWKKTNGHFLTDSLGPCPGESAYGIFKIENGETAMEIFYVSQRIPWVKAVVLSVLLTGLVVSHGVDAALAQKHQNQGRQALGGVSEKPIYQGYPLDFSGRGRIDRIGDGEIVIGDGLFKVNSGVRFNRPNQLGTSMSNFSAGEKIGFIIDKKGNLKSVWLLKKKGK